MMVNADLYVKDLPGHLVGSLEPISMVDGNIVGVVHDREQKVNQRICVNVTFKIDSNVELDKLKEIWKTRDVMIARIGSVYETYTMNYMLVGSFTASYIERLLDEASNVVAYESVDVSYSSTNEDSTKTAMLTVEVKSKDELDKLDSFLNSACKEAGIIYIRGL